MSRNLRLLLVLAFLLSGCAGQGTNESPTATPGGAASTHTDATPLAARATASATGPAVALPQVTATATQGTAGASPPVSGTPGASPSPARTDRPIAFRSAPWKPGERATYTITTKATGQPAGQATFTFGREFEADSISAKIVIGSTSDSFLIGFTTKTLRPVSELRTIVTPAGETSIRSEFHPGGATIEITEASGTRRAVLSLPDDYFANDQFLMLLRALPFATGYRGALSLVPSRGSPATIQTTVTVVGQEIASVGQGPQPAWLVEAGFDGATQKFWYGVDAPHALLRYENDKFVYVLTTLSSP